MFINQSLDRSLQVLDLLQKTSGLVLGESLDVDVARPNIGGPWGLHGSGMGPGAKEKAAHLRVLTAAATPRSSKASRASLA